VPPMTTIFMTSPLMMVSRQRRHPSRSPPDRFQGRFVDSPGWSSPTLRFLAGCCARAASGHAAAVPPTSVMNSRRRISAPKLGRHSIVSAQTGTLIGADRHQNWHCHRHCRFRAIVDIANQISEATRLYLLVSLNFQTSYQLIRRTLCESGARVRNLWTDVFCGSCGRIKFRAYSYLPPSQKYKNGALRQMQRRRANA
jgi:hypothetical protein